MQSTKPVFGFIGIAVGALALMLAMVSFWAGPFSQQPDLEQTIAEKVVAIRDATVAALKREDTVVPEPTAKRYDLDKIASVSTAVLGGLAIILAVIGIALKEPFRVTGGAAFLGMAAIAFQFAVLALGVLVLVILFSSVFGGLGFG